MLRKLPEIKICRTTRLSQHYLSHLPFKLDPRCANQTPIVIITSTRSSQYSAGFRTSPACKLVLKEDYVTGRLSSLSISSASGLGFYHIYRIGQQSFYYKEEEFWSRKIKLNICFQAGYFNSLRLLPYLD